MGEKRRLTVNYGSFSCIVEGMDDPVDILREVFELCQEATERDPRFGVPEIGSAGAAAERIIATRLEERMTQLGAALTRDPADGAIVISPAEEEEDGQEHTAGDRRPDADDATVVGAHATPEGGDEDGEEDRAEEDDADASAARTAAESLSDEDPEAPAEAEARNAESPEGAEGWHAEAPDGSQEPLVLDKSMSPKEDLAAAEDAEPSGSPLDRLAAQRADRPSGGGFFSRLRKQRDEDDDAGAREPAAAPRSPAPPASPAHQGAGIAAAPRPAAGAEPPRGQAEARRPEAPQTPAPPVAAPAAGPATPQAQPPAPPPGPPEAPRKSAAEILKELPSVPGMLPLSSIPDDIEDRLDAFFSGKPMRERTGEAPASQASAPQPQPHAPAAPPPPQQLAPPSAQPPQAPPTPSGADHAGPKNAGALILSSDLAVPPDAPDDEPPADAGGEEPRGERHLRIIRPQDRDAETAEQDEDPAEEEEEDEEDGIPFAEALRSAEGVSLARFARHFGARDLLGEMEAAAAYATLLGATPRFSRSELTQLVNDLPHASRQGPEIRIRAFGKLIRTGSLLRVDGDKFALAPEVRSEYEAGLGL